MSTEEGTVTVEGTEAARPFGGLTASEAGRRSGEARSAGGGSDRKVVQALERKAQQGDPSAARELRAWLERVEGKAPIDRPLKDLSPRERQELASRIAARRQAEPEGEARPGVKVEGPGTPTPADE